MVLDLIIWFWINLEWVYNLYIMWRLFKSFGLAYISLHFEQWLFKETPICRLLRETKNIS